MLTHLINGLSPFESTQQLNTIKYSTNLFSFLKCFISEQDTRPFYSTHFLIFPPLKIFGIVFRLILSGSKQIFIFHLHTKNKELQKTLKLIDKLIEILLVVKSYYNMLNILDNFVHVHRYTV
jgi:hypothetical protein